MNRMLLLISTLSLSCGSWQALAEGAALQDGNYYSVMGHYLYGAKSGQIDNGVGGSVGAGWSFGQGWAVEANALYTDLKTSSRGEGADLVPAASTSYVGGSVDALYFPSQRLPGLFGLFGAGGLQVSKYPTRLGSDFGTVSVEAGLGYLFDVARLPIRTQLVFRRAERFTQIQRVKEGDSYADIDAPHSFKDLVLSVGIQLPMKPAAAPPPAPVAVVAPAAPPDADGDGVADDMDRCPGTQPGIKVDQFGCPLPAPCKTPEAGERVSLGGCGTGEVIVLRGVTFATDSAELDPNARAILDNVGDELKAYPEITLEISGHTDSVGSEEYNRALSDRRAASVVSYLSETGVDSARLVSVGRGEAQPVADNETEEGRQLNRRTELTITQGVSAAANATSAPTESAPSSSAGGAAADESTGQTPVVAPLSPPTGEQGGQASAVESAPAESAEPTPF